jgi:predicted  nucleic acid-binding Zn-ribbon protein
MSSDEKIEERKRLCLRAVALIREFRRQINRLEKGLRTGFDTARYDELKDAVAKAENAPKNRDV